MAVESVGAVRDSVAVPMSPPAVRRCWSLAAAARARRPGWDALFAPMAAPAAGCGHRRGVQRDHVPAITDSAAEAVGEQFAPGDHDPGGGGDVDELTTDRAG